MSGDNNLIYNLKIFVINKILIPTPENIEYKISNIKYQYFE